MATVKVAGKDYEVPEEVERCMRNLRYERDWNYDMAQGMEVRLKRMIKILRIVSGLSTVKHVQKQLFVQK